MKFIVTLKWIPALNRWDVIKENGFTLYDIPGCENVDIMFDHPSKEKEQQYVIDITRLLGSTERKQHGYDTKGASGAIERVA